MKGKIILASASPRRIELLRSLGMQLEVVPSGLEEPHVSGETPEEHVVRLSRHKAEAVAVNYPDEWVLGADTIVVLEDEILGKPDTMDTAGRMLAKLSGRRHKVYTGFTVINLSSNMAASEVVESSVFFRSISDDERNWYIKSDEPYDKAGGYAVQGMGAFFIREIHGSYTNVMGLPLCEVVDVLKRVGALGFNGGNHGIHDKR